MKRARHIQLGRVVHSTEVSHLDYYGMFECPTCKAILTHREGYATSSGRKIQPAFVHPSGGTSEQIDCPERVKITIENDNRIPNLSEVMGNKKQFYALLNRKLLIALGKNNSYTLAKIRPLFDKNIDVKKNTDTLNASDYRSFDLGYVNKKFLKKLLSTAMLFLGSRKNEKSVIDRRRFIEEKIVELCENPYLSVGDFEHTSYIYRLEKYKLPVTKEQLIAGSIDTPNKHVRRVIWFLDFLNASKDKKLHDKVLDYAFGDLLLNKDISFDDLSFWSWEDLDSIEQVIKNEETAFYSKLYQSPGSASKPEMEDEFNLAIKFHEFIFNSLTVYFTRFKWPYLFQDYLEDLEDV